MLHDGLRPMRCLLRRAVQLVCTPAARLLSCVEIRSWSSKCALPIHGESKQPLAL